MYVGSGVWRNYTSRQEVPNDDKLHEEYGDISHTAIDANAGPSRAVACEVSKNNHHAWFPVRNKLDSGFITPFLLSKLLKQKKTNYIG